MRTTLKSPSGSSVYFIFALINCLAFPPVTGAKDAYDTAAIGKADGEDAALDHTETEISLLIFAVCEVLGDHAVWVGKCILRQRESHPVPLLVFGILVFVPLEPRSVHALTLAQHRDGSHMNVWDNIWLPLTCRLGGQGARKKRYRTPFRV